MMHEDIRFTFRFGYDGNAFELDTAELREILGDDISFQEPEVSAYISEYLEENIAEVLDGKTI